MLRLRSHDGTSFITASRKEDGRLAIRQITDNADGSFSSRSIDTEQSESLYSGLCRLTGKIFNPNDYAKTDRAPDRIQEYIDREESKLNGAILRFDMRMPDGRSFSDLSFRDADFLIQEAYRDAIAQRERKALDKAIEEGDNEMYARVSYAGDGPRFDPFNPDFEEGRIKVKAFIDDGKGTRNGIVPEFGIGFSDCSAYTLADRLGNAVRESMNREDAERIGSLIRKDADRGAGAVSAMMRRDLVRTLEMMKHDATDPRVAADDGLPPLLRSQTSFTHGITGQLRLGESEAELLDDCRKAIDNVKGDGYRIERLQEYLIPDEKERNEAIGKERPYTKERVAGMLMDNLSDAFGPYLWEEMSRLGSGPDSRIAEKAIGEMEKAGLPASLVPDARTIAEEGFDAEKAEALMDKAAALNPEIDRSRAVKNLCIAGYALDPSSPADIFTRESDERLTSIAMMLPAPDDTRSAESDMADIEDAKSKMVAAAITGDPKDIDSAIEAAGASAETRKAAVRALSAISGYSCTFISSARISLETRVERYDAMLRDRKEGFERLRNIPIELVDIMQSVDDEVKSEMPDEYRKLRNDLLYRKGGSVFLGRIAESIRNEAPDFIDFSNAEKQGYRLGAVSPLTYSGIVSEGFAERILEDADRVRGDMKENLKRIIAGHSYSWESDRKVLDNLVQGMYYRERNRLAADLIRKSKGNLIAELYMAGGRRDFDSYSAALKRLSEGRSVSGRNDLASDALLFVLSDPANAEKMDFFTRSPQIILEKGPSLRSIGKRMDPSREAEHSHASAPVRQGISEISKAAETEKKEEKAKAAPSIDRFLAKPASRKSQGSRDSR